MADQKSGQIPTISTINSKPDEDEILARVDPQYADEKGRLGHMPDTGADDTEEDVDELAKEVGIHTEGDQEIGPKPLTDTEDITSNTS